MHHDRANVQAARMLLAAALATLGEFGIRLGYSSPHPIFKSSPRQHGFAALVRQAVSMPKFLGSKPAGRSWLAKLDTCMAKAVTLSKTDLALIRLFQLQDWKRPNCKPLLAPRC